MPTLPVPMACALVLLGIIGLGTCRALAGPDASVWQPPNEAALPAGFPAPTEPGRMLLKWYPAVRGATVRLEGRLSAASVRGFWPLFRHIQRERIEMTAPVVSNYEPSVRSSELGAVDMTFLYPSSQHGSAAAEGASGVRVEDSTPLCVVSIGVEGSYGMGNLRTAVAKLDAWLLENAATWRAAGPPRRLAYQQPLPLKRLYSEVQIPVEPMPLPR